MIRSHKIVMILLVLMSVLAVAFTSSAQDTINYGDVITDTATGEEILYSLSAEAGDVIALVLESEDFDPTLTLLDPAGDETAFNDDSIGLSSQIAYSVPVAGDYTVIVSAFNNGPEGDFTLIVIGGACILLDGTATGDIVEYFWTIPEGEIVVVNLESPDFDTLIRVADDSDEVLETDDDSGEGLNSRLAFISPADGIYSIGVSKFGTADPEGDYTIVVSGGTVIEDSVSETTEFTTFEGVENTTVIISLVSEDFDPVVRVLDANGIEVASNDDGGQGLNSLLEFTPTQDGEYTIVVDSVLNAPDGNFQLGVVLPCEVDGDIVGGDGTSTDSITAGMNIVDGGTINVGDTVEADANASVDVYSVELDADQTIQISLSSEDFDTIVIVTDSMGTEQLAINDDINYPDNTNSEVEFTAPSAGTFTIIVGSYTGIATGSYTLSVE